MKKGKQSSVPGLLLLLTPASTQAPPPSASTYSSTPHLFPPSSSMLLSALTQDEASGHMGIYPDSGSNKHVGEDAPAGFLKA